MGIDIVPRRQRMKRITATVVFAMVLAGLPCRVSAGPVATDSAIDRAADQVAQALRSRSVALAVPDVPALDGRATDGRRVNYTTMPTVPPCPTLVSVFDVPERRDDPASLRVAPLQHLQPFDQRPSGHVRPGYSAQHQR